MSKITITAPEDRDITVIGRNVGTGQDGQSVTIPAGKTATIEIDGQNQAVVSTSHADGDIPGQSPQIAQIDESGKEPAEVMLRPGEDAEVVGVIRGLPQDVARTRDGFVSSEALNAALAEAGMQPVNAARRNSLSVANNLVKVPA